MRYSITCNIDDSSKIFLDSSDRLVCESGTIEVIPHQPSLSDFPDEQINELIVVTVGLLFLAYVFRLIFKFLS